MTPQKPQVERRKLLEHKEIKRVAAFPSRDKVSSLSGICCEDRKAVDHAIIGLLLHVLALLGKDMSMSFGSMLSSLTSIYAEVCGIGITTESSISTAPYQLLASFVVS